MIGWLAINSITIRVGQALIKAQFRTVRLTISTLLGGILLLRWQDFGFFWPPTPYVDIFYGMNVDQKVDIFGPPTPLILST